MTDYIHNVPGRLRIKSIAIKNDRCAAETITKLLQGLPGIDRIALNRETGSCLINYDPRMATGDHIASLLSREGYFNPVEAVTNDECILSAAARLLSFMTAFL